MTHSFRDILRRDYKSIWGLYVSVKKGNDACYFDYTNDSDYPERVSAALLSPLGQPVPKATPKDFSVLPRQTIRLHAGQWVREAGLEDFEGALFVVRFFENAETAPKEKIPPRAVMCNWNSQEHHAQVGVGPLQRLNEPDMKNRLSYFMFCPSFMVTDDYATKVVLFNYSTNADYDETVVVAPSINDSHGNSFVGESITVPPFGMAIWSAEKYLLNGSLRPNERYSLSASYAGNTFPAFMFQVGRKNGALITGRHTQPSASILRPHSVNLWANIAREYIPFVSDALVGIGKRILGKGAKTVVEREMD